MYKGVISRDEKHPRKETKLQYGLQKAELQSMRVLQNNWSWGSLYTGKKMRQGRSSINVYILGRNRMRKNQMSSKLENVDSRYPRRNCFPRTWNSRHQHHQQLWESLSEPLAQFKRSIFPLGLSHRLSQFVSTSLIRSSQVNRQAGGKFVNLSHWIPFIWWFWAQTHDA